MLLEGVLLVKTSEVGLLTFLDILLAVPGDDATDLLDFIDIFDCFFPLRLLTGKSSSSSELT